jgi:hypothetical protein
VIADSKISSTKRPKIGLAFPAQIKFPGKKAVRPPKNIFFTVKSNDRVKVYLIDVLTDKSDHFILSK